VHDFAEQVIRPAAHEWDEREETPWPIMEEAAKIGLYSLEFVANAFADATGLQLALAVEELAWGDAGIALAIMGSTLAVAGIMANGTPEQQAEWIPQCFGTPDDMKLAAFAVSEADAGSDVSSLKTRAIYDQAKDEWVLNGTKTWITNGGLANLRRSAHAARPASSFPRRPPVSARARSSRRWGSARRTRPRSSSRTAAFPDGACSAGKTGWTSD
jgi:alkylation response protein AidB-like acyl-CoA dehydrogenase